MPRVSEIWIYEQRECSTLVERTRVSVQNIVSVTSKVYSDIFTYLAELNEVPCGAPFITYHNSDMNDMDIAAGVPVPKEFPQRGDVVPCKLPNVKVVACIHRGPYHTTSPTYEEMHKWVASNGLTPVGIVREVYLNDPRNTPEDELLTEILMPIK